MTQDKFTKFARDAGWDKQRPSVRLQDPYAYNGVSPVRVLDNEKGYVRNGKTEAWFDPQKHDPVLISRIFNADLGDEAIEDLSK